MDGILRLLPAFLAADLLLPFLLAPFCKGYRHRDQVMSALGGGVFRPVYSGGQTRLSKYPPGLGGAVAEAFAAVYVCAALGAGVAG